MNKLTAGEVAEIITCRFWTGKREEVIAYLRGRGFSHKGANACFESFSETMAFVARETGVPQFNMK